MKNAILCLYTADKKIFPVLTQGCAQAIVQHIIGVEII